MRTRTLALSIISVSVSALAVFSPLSAVAADQAVVAEKPANEQVVVPDVDRRDIKMPRFPSNDFEIGVYTGTYATQNFGSSVVAGLRAGYHITEDIFVEAVYAQTKVSDEAFRQVLPGGVFAQPKEKLKYYNLSAGYNILPGEVFIGSKRAKASALYVIGGVGSTSFNDQRRQTFNLGLGTRLFLTDKAALQVDMRDHIFSMDLLGKRKSTNNVEFTGGVTIFF
jgi:outer membrane beta-barrel protein